jgi:DNA gyrase subunit A
VSDKDDLVCITSQGNTVKLRLAEVAPRGKTAMGVRSVNITKPDVVVGIARVVKEDQSVEAPGMDVPESETADAAAPGDEPAVEE